MLSNFENFHRKCPIWTKFKAKFGLLLTIFTFKYEITFYYVIFMVTSWECYSATFLCRFQMYQKTCPIPKVWSKFSQWNLVPFWAILVRFSNIRSICMKFCTLGHFLALISKILLILRNLHRKWHFWAQKGQIWSVSSIFSRLGWNFALRANF